MLWQMSKTCLQRLQPLEEEQAPKAELVAFGTQVLDPSAAAVPALCLAGY